MRSTGGFAVDWLNSIWESDIPHQCKYLACYLRKFMNRQSAKAWPSYKRIIDETGLSRMTVSRYMKALEDAGWIIRQKGRTGKNTIYIAKIPEGKAVKVVPDSDHVVSEGYQVVSEGYLSSTTQVHELNKGINNIIISKTKGKRVGSADTLKLLTDRTWSDHLLID